MSNPSKYYLDYIHSAYLGYRATWEPNLPIELGSIVKIDSFGSINMYGSLSDYGVAVNILESHSAAVMNLSSQNDVQVTFNGAATAPVGPVPSANAVISIKFGKENGVIFKLDGYKTAMVKNISEVENTVLDFYNKKKWEPDLLIVTQLISADTATIIISDKGEASVDLKAAADAGIDELSLTNAKLGLTVANQTGSTVQFIGNQGISPLFKVMGIVGSGFFGMGGKQLGTRDLLAQDHKEAPALAVIEPTYA